MTPSAKLADFFSMKGSAACLHGLPSMRRSQPAFDIACFSSHAAVRAIWLPNQKSCAVSERKDRISIAILQMPGRVLSMKLAAAIQR